MKLFRRRNKKHWYGTDKELTELIESTVKSGESSSICDGLMKLYQKAKKRLGKKNKL
jgi:hypothetical protein